MPSLHNIDYAYLLLHAHFALATQPNGLKNLYLFERTLLMFDIGEFL